MRARSRDLAGRVRPLATAGGDHGISDPAAAAPFLPTARTWATRALHDLRIEVIIVTLPDTIRASILEAQRRQYR